MKKQKVKEFKDSIAAARVKAEGLVKKRGEISGGKNELRFNSMIRRAVRDAYRLEEQLESIERVMDMMGIE